ncbi:MAG TPA: hypothetical protein VE650_03470 [Acetobacteraceae bacterium]|nr:hypothetical protein [Acetobacteraceae bacterium]
MSTIGRSPFAWLEFDENGGLVDPGAVAKLALLLAPATIGDLVVIAHGWKNDKADATRLYSTLWNNSCAALRTKQPERIAVCGILWPAKAYQTDFDQAALMDAGDGQTLSASGTGTSRDLNEDEFAAILDDFRDVFGPAAEDAIAKARAAAERGLNDARARALYHTATAAAGPDPASPDRELAADAVPFSNPDDAQAIIAGLAAPPPMRTKPGMGATQGLLDGASTVFSGTRAAIARFLNQLTYYAMKKRAGVVGAALGGTVLPQLAPGHPVRLHLVGHSFGARLVTAAASGLPPQLALDFFSLTLLQGAFSHNALAAMVQPGLPGAFANVIGRPRGPIAVTHTHNDRACTLWYALASRLSRDIAAAIGDHTDPYGAMGANGPQHLDPNARAQGNAGPPFAPVAGKVNPFLADGYVVQTDQTDAHNNVTNATVGQLVAAVIEA